MSCGFRRRAARKWAHSGRSRCTAAAIACWSPGLVYDADGGLSIDIRADHPGEGRNWLPAPRDEGFYLTLRLYQPQRAHLEGTFDYPPVRRVG
jgi:hypothetical protein